MSNSTIATRLRSHTRKITRSSASSTQAEPAAIAAVHYNVFDDDLTATSFNPSLYVGIDVGTNSTAVAYRNIDWPHEIILTVGNFAGDENQGRANRQIPTESAYPTHFAMRSTGATLRIGYEALALSGMPDNDVECTMYPETGRVTRMKLLLEPGNHVHETRKELVQQLAGLQASRHITEPRHVLRDFIVEILRHTKHVLENQGYLSNPHNERDAQSVLTCEPEVAMLYIVKKGLCNVQAGDIVVLLDCGGGTLDSGAWLIERGDPLRLGEEVIPVIGRLVGATDVNERFARMALEDLPDHHKRIFDVLNDLQAQNKRYTFRFFNLRASPVNQKLKKGYYVLSYADMASLFEPTVREISKVMHLQLERVLATHNAANKLTVSGGFADSPFLRNILREDLFAYNQTRLTHTEITFPPARESGPGVAIGNVLRGLDKRHSPPRILQFNFGVAQYICVEEPEERKQYSAQVLAQRSQKKQLEGARYIGPVIKYILRKTFISRHNFSPMSKEWISWEEIFASEICNEDFYLYDHEKNKGARSLGNTKLDLTPLRDLIKIHAPEHRKDGQRRYVVDLLIELRVTGRNLEFFAKLQLEGMKEPRVIRGSRLYHNLVAALPPGTV